MKESKKAIRYAGYTLGREKYNSGLYLTLFLGAALMVYVYRGYGKWLLEAGEAVNLWEPYLWFQSSRTSQIPFLLISVYLGYQSVNAAHNQCYAIVRMSRSGWAVSRMIHLAGMILLCNVILLISTWLACAGRIYIQNKWSSSAVMAAQYGIDAVGGVPIVWVDYGVMGGAPWLAGLWAFALSNLAGLFTGFLLMLFTVSRKFAWGMALFGILWYVGIFIDSEPFFAPLHRVSPYDLARVTETALGYGSLSVLYSALFLIFLCVILGAALILICGKVDFGK